MYSIQMSFYLWKRLLSAQGSFLFYQGEFWYHLNKGWHDMNYRWFWGNVSPEVTVISHEAYDKLVEMLNEAPKKNEALEKLMKKPKPWS